MEEVSVSQFKMTCLELVRKVEATGQPVLITRRGQPVAQLTAAPPPAAGSSWLGSEVGSGRILGDIVSPLDPEDWEALSSL